eukprot:3767644-Alexandrium_andersonii.AAC.1
MTITPQRAHIGARRMRGTTLTVRASRGALVKQMWGALGQGLAVTSLMRETVCACVRARAGVCVRARVRACTRACIWANVRANA